ncbi:MAG: division/cell wall cluster transcriptional repressor MraZ [Calditrichaeota bacterium]|nr:MAG: division/cell wall cluster transcriptional repressor MraZ [Calditrichota bacterium]
MTDLSGRYTVSLDPKGRLAIPTRFRTAFPEGQQDDIILTRGFDPCITGFYRDSWKEFQEIFDDHQLTQEEMDVIEREFIGRKLETTFDKQGRITLPPHLVEFAQLENLSEVTAIGVRNRIEIWNPKLYDEIRAQKEKVIQDLRQKLKAG